MPSNTPLTDAIEALTRYANETTGQSDTTLSDAVGTLVAGYGGGGRLPSEYQEVAYVGIWDNCYFDLGELTSSNPGFSMSFLPTNRISAGGPHIVSTNNDYLVFAPRGANTLLKLCGAESTNASTTLGFETTAEFNINSNGYFRMTWATSGMTSTTITKGSITSGRVYLFAYGGNPSQTMYHYNGLVFSFVLYDDGVIVKNLVPCYRKADDVIGFYDTVNSAFLTTSGSGSLTKGADVK